MFSAYVGEQWNFAPLSSLCTIRHSETQVKVEACSLRTVMISSKSLPHTAVMRDLYNPA